MISVKNLQKQKEQYIGNQLYKYLYLSGPRKCEHTSSTNINE